VDALGTRKGFFVTWSGGLWRAHPRARHRFAMLAASRFLLGMGEAADFRRQPSGGGVVSVRERSTAMGIMNAGTSAGSVIAPPLIAVVLSAMSWRWVSSFLERSA